jgi:hypothetical protein
MVRRRIGQEQLALDGGSRRSGSSLDQMATLIDWTQIDRQLEEIYRSPPFRRSSTPARAIDR